VFVVIEIEHAFIEFFGNSRFIEKDLWLINFLTTVWELCLMSSNSICAIVVTYNPSLKNLLQLLSQLSLQKCDTIVVDNSDNQSAIIECNAFSYIWLGGNKGIATAQNAGIKECIKNGYKHAIFFDQDSNISSDFIRSLNDPLVKNSFLICAPVFFDEKRGFEYAITDIKSNGTRQKLYSEGRIEPFTSSVVISSGTMVDVGVFDIVGDMDDGLFIDYVDTEWCLRCFAKDILVHVIPQAKMIHSIGDNTFNLFKFTVPVHSASRRYYRVRNSFHLLRYKHVPKLLAFREIIFCVIHSLILIAKQRNRKDYVLSFLTGIRDGVLNVRGEKPKH